MVRRMNPQQGPASLQPGENQELDTLAEVYGAALGKYFAKRGCQPSTVDDLVQDVFVRMAGRTSGERLDNPEAYLMRTASNVWKDHLRRRQVRNHTAHISYEEDRHAVEDFSPERVYEGRQSIERLVVVLRDMPERTRQVFVLRRLEGMKQKDVARRIGVSESAVEKHMVKAIAFLADRFGEDQ